MRRTYAVLLGALLSATAVVAQDTPITLSERQVEELAFFRRLGATQALPRTLEETFRYGGTTYFLEGRTDCHCEGCVGYRLVDLCGNDAPLEAQLAFITRDLEPLSVPEPVPVPLTQRDRSSEGIVRKSSLHWVPIGIARSHAEPAGKGKQNYLPWALGATLFTFRMDGGRVSFLGAGAGLAVGNSDPESESGVTLHLTLVPVSIRVWDRWHIAPTFGTAEVSGIKVPAWPRPFSWKGFKTVGVQVSACLTGCG